MIMIMKLFAAQIQIDLTAKGHKQSKWQPRPEQDGDCNDNNPHSKWYYGIKEN